MLLPFKLVETRNLATVGLNGKKSEGATMLSLVKKSYLEVNYQVSLDSRLQFWFSPTFVQSDHCNKGF